MKKKNRFPLLGAASMLAGLLALIFLWWLLSYFLHQNGNRLLPYPQEAFAALAEVLFGGRAPQTYAGIGWTLGRLALGFAASFLFGAALGTAAGLHPLFRRFMAPAIALGRTVPTAAVVLILVSILYSYEGWPPYIPCFLVFLVAAPIIYEAFASGILAEPSDETESMRLEGAERSLRGIISVYWPDSLSYILLGIAQSLGLAMKVAVMSEIIVNSSEAYGGIGGLIQGAMLYLEMKYVIAYSLIAVFIIALIDIPMHYLKKHLRQKLEN